MKNEMSGCLGRNGNKNVGQGTRRTGVSPDLHVTTTRGFTLIELLVVVLIIGILASVALPQYQKAVRKAHFAKAITRVNAIEKQIELFYLEQPQMQSGSGAIILYDPNTIRGSSRWLLYEGALGLTQGLTCDAGNMNHVCNDGYYQYTSICWWNDHCTIGVYPINYDDGKGVRLEIDYNSGNVSSRRCTGSRKEKTLHLCDMLQGNWTIEDSDRDLDWDY